MSRKQPPRNFQVISPEDVGNKAIAAIKENVFLVVTHEEDKKNIQKRAQDIQRLINRRADVLAQREEMVAKLLQSMKQQPGQAGSATLNASQVNTILKKKSVKYELYTKLTLGIMSLPFSYQSTRVFLHFRSNPGKAQRRNRGRIEP